MQYFVTFKLLKVIFTHFFGKKNKNWEIQFLRDEPYFFKKKKIHSPGGEPAMVLRYITESTEDGEGMPK